MNSKKAKEVTNALFCLFFLFFFAKKKKIHFMHDESGHTLTFQADSTSQTQRPSTGFCFYEGHRQHRPFFDADLSLSPNS